MCVFAEDLRVWDLVSHACLKSSPAEAPKMAASPPSCWLLRCLHSPLQWWGAGITCRCSIGLRADQQGLEGSQREVEEVAALPVRSTAPP